MSNNDGNARAPSEARREFLTAGVCGLGVAGLMAAASSEARASAQPLAVLGTEHWVTRTAGDDSVRLFVWRKQLRHRPPGLPERAPVLFVHGSSEGGGPTYDLQVPGRPEYSVMDWFARLGYDTWMLDCEGYGRSDKHRAINADVANGADDVFAVAQFIARTTAQPKLQVYGASSGSLRAGLFAQRHPELVQRLILDAFVWTGEGSPTLAERKLHLADYRASNRRPINRDSVRRIFTRDHPGSSDPAFVEAFADAVLALDTSVPNGTYIDMSANLPLVDPAQITVPTSIMRGEFDGIATFQDVDQFFARLPVADKQFALMPGVAHASLQSRNWALVYHVLEGFLSQPAPVYTGAAS